MVSTRFDDTISQYFGKYYDAKRRRQKEMKLRETGLNNSAKVHWYMLFPQLDHKKAFT